MQVQHISNARMAKFGSGVVLRSRNDEPLELDLIRRAAPSVFAEEKHASRSARFEYVPTFEIMAAMAEEGFHPFEVRQGGSRDVEKRSFTKHLIKFRKLGDRPKNVGDSVREILALNAHDGTSSYKVMSGLFKMVCSNGLIVSSGDMTHIAIPHKGNIADQFIDAAYTVLDDGLRIDDHVARMQHVTLTQPEQLVLAESALQIRYGEEPAPIQPRQLIAPRRSADAGPDLWNTFNRIQENMVERGGLRYLHRNPQTRRIQNRETRPVNGIGDNVRLNQALWTLAEKMLELKGA